MRQPLRLLALDIGAESGRGVVGSFDGSCLQVEEVARFANVPVRLGGTLHWDFLRLFGDVVATIGHAGRIDSVGVDAWGVDFGLLDSRGRLLGNPVHYRDARTDGMMERALEQVSRQDIYAATGVQFMPINTLYQLLSLVSARDPELDRAERLLLMPDLLNHFLSGSSVVEYTNATTTQCFDAGRGEWASSLLERLGIPTRLFPEVVQPGTKLGTLRDDLGLGAVRVVAPGTHDTASAVAAIPLSPGMAYLSSGTWSLLGLEVQQPYLSDAALAANLTNEGGVAGRIRLLRNVVGLWLVQQVRSALGGSVGYEELMAMAEAATPFSGFIDVDDERLLRPGADLGAFVPHAADTGTLVRVLLESLALKYAQVLRQLETVTGLNVERIHVVGGGVQNTLLCQLTADATGLEVRAGPAEATALGNLLVQAIATGELGSLAEGRELVLQSFPPRTYEPRGKRAAWPVQ